MKYMKDKVMVVCVCGLAGSGKDTFARMLQERNKDVTKGQAYMDVVTSYTTRPMRNGEMQSREHHFLTEVPEDVELFAFAKYGEALYWTTEYQIRQHDVTIYVVDEQGIAQIQAKAKAYAESMTAYRNTKSGNHHRPWEFKVLNVLVTASDEIRRERCQDEGRLARDKGRNLDDVAFDYVVENNGSLTELKLKAAYVHTAIANIWNRYSKDE